MEWLRGCLGMHRSTTCDDKTAKVDEEKRKVINTLLLRRRKEPRKDFKGQGANGECDVGPSNDKLVHSFVEGAIEEETSAEVLGKRKTQVDLPETDEPLLDTSVISNYERRLQNLAELDFGSLRSQLDTQDIACAICLNDMVDPHVTGCGHSFCHRCIFDALLITKKCPLCRADVKKKRTQSIPVLEKLVSKLTSDTEYKARVVSNATWVADKTIPRTIQRGFELDVRDTLYIWCKGVVRDVLKTNDGKHTILYIHYQDWDDLYDEFIPVTSCRLAPLGMYSNRPELAHYPYRQFQYMYTRRVRPIYLGHGTAQLNVFNRVFEFF